MCAIFGLIDYKRVFTAKQREKILKALSVECEVRGTDATGFAFNSGGQLRIFKRPLAASEMCLRLKEDANIILGHTRMATQGDKQQNYNNHPFFGKCDNTRFALAHNGILYNETFLRRELNIPETHIETDSYIAVQILKKLGELNETNLTQMAESVNGSFVFTLLDEDNNSYFVRGDNPLTIYHFDAGFYIYASTEAILDKALFTLGISRLPYKEISTDCGDILKIDANGKLTRSTFVPDVPYWDWHYDYYIDEFDCHKLFQHAEKYGVEEEYVQLLLDYGYLAEEIEDMFGIPGAVKMAANEVFREYGWCEEW